MNAEQLAWGFAGLSLFELLWIVWQTRRMRRMRRRWALDTRSALAFSDFVANIHGKETSKALFEEVVREHRRIHGKN